MAKLKKVKILQPCTFVSEEYGKVRFASGQYSISESLAAELVAAGKAEAVGKPASKVVPKKVKKVEV